MKFGNTGKKIINGLFLVYLAVLFRITVFRPGIRLENLFENGSINLSLFTGYIPLVTGGHWWMFCYLFLGNIIWFVPFGLFVKRIGRQSFAKTVLFGFCLSLTIEVLQYVFGTGYSELDDLVLNTLGAAVGALAGYIRIPFSAERHQPR